VTKSVRNACSSDLSCLCGCLRCQAHCRTGGGFHLALGDASARTVPTGSRLLRGHGAGFRPTTTSPSPSHPNGSQHPGAAEQWQLAHQCHPHPSGHRPQGNVRQRELHHPHPGPAGQEEQRGPALPVRARRPAGVHGALALETGRSGFLTTAVPSTTLWLTTCQPGRSCIGRRSSAPPILTGGTFQS
jgi:hypothetical protein